MKQRMVNVVKWASGIFIVLGALYGVLYLAASGVLRRAYAALEADGRPMKAEQIIPAQIPDTDNAALICNAVVLQLQSEVPISFGSAPTGQGAASNLLCQVSDLAAKMISDSPDVEATEQFRQLARTKAVTDALFALERAAAKPNCRYDIDYTKGVEILLPHLAPARQLTRMLCAMARLQAGDGNVAGAWRTQLTSLRLANGLKGEPVLISQLVRAAQLNLIVQSIQAIAVTLPSDAQYAEIQELLKESEGVAPLVRAIDGDRLLFAEWAYSLPRAEFGRRVIEFEGGRQRYVLLGALYSPFMPADHAAYLRIMDAYARNAAASYALGDTRLADTLVSTIPWYGVMTRTLAPALGRLKVRYLTMVARARLTRAGLAVLRHRRATGAYPTDLKGVGPDDAVDPFSEQPLRYRALPAGFVLYSVGENQIDDNGTESKEDGAGDIVWRHTDSTPSLPSRPSIAE